MVTIMKIPKELITFNIKSIMTRFERAYGYKPSVYDLVESYYQGELSLLDEEENDLIRLIEVIS